MTFLRRHFIKNIHQFFFIWQAERWEEPPNQKSGDAQTLSEASEINFEAWREERLQTEAINIRLSGHRQEYCQANRWQGNLVLLNSSYRNVLQKLRRDKSGKINFAYALEADEASETVNWVKVEVHQTWQELICRQYTYPRSS